MSQSGELQGKVAIVTGAGSGIGAASARALGAAGASVVIADLRGEAAAATAEALNGDGIAATPVTVDTSNEEQVAAMVKTAADTYGGLDILHNNAASTDPAHMMRDMAIHEMDVELWDRTMAVNLRGYMLGTKHAVPHMLRRGGGAIVNTASGTGLQAELVRSAYGSSKAGIIGFTRNVATQYGKQGIRCVAIAPGLIMTPSLAANMPPEMQAMMERHHLTPRLGRPEDIADAVAFLVSDRAGFITGITLPIDGGFSVHTPSYVDDMAMLEAMREAHGG
jgi:NAD(P)-dependent dehydrogenase (short-subunit alcohol dehydrogenase family)